MDIKLLSEILNKGDRGFPLMNNEPTHVNTKHKSDLIGLSIKGYVTSQTYRVGDGWYELYYITDEGISELK